MAVIRPKRQFMKWANSHSLDDREFDMEHFMEYYSLAILTPYYDLYSRKLAKRYINMLCGQIFEDQLRHWNPDEESWPTGRDKKMFQQFFTIEFVYDVVE